MANASISGLSERVSVPTCDHRRLIVKKLQSLSKYIINPSASACRRSTLCTNTLQDARQWNQLWKRTITLSNTITKNSFHCIKLQQWQRGSVTVQCLQAIERPSAPAASRENGTHRAQQSTEANVADWVLPDYDQSTGMVELVIAGAGPSGLAVAERVSQAGGFLAQQM